MPYLVTGSHGCIGAWVLKALVARGERPVAYDVSDDPWRFAMIAEPEDLERVIFVQGSVGELVELIREALPGSKTLLSYDPEAQVPVASAFDDTAFRQALGPLPPTPLQDGIRRTLARFERLLRGGRLDTRELA